MSIAPFPIITDPQVVLVSNDLYTGIIVDKGMKFSLSETDDVWTVFNDIEEAIKEANRIVTEYDHIECMIFGKGEKLIKHVTPS